MRLINVHTKRLEDFTLKPKPEYAILSHTWGDDEATYQDLLSGEAPNRKGWVKILQTCRLAVEDGLEYAWVDTCCIDKSSSAELSEAINSMYRWYKESKVCYAYLADLESHGDIMKSRWWTRGWTLQELLAPKVLEFLNGSWQRNGSRDLYSAAIAAATPIPSAVLCKMENLHELSVAARMSWASLRHTTRLEDEAYCLLGIFNVNIALIYGEGRHAFRRLLEAIINTNADLTMFACTAKSLLPPSPKAYCYQDVHSFTRSHAEFSLTNRGVKFAEAFPLYRAWDGIGGYRVLMRVGVNDDSNVFIALRLVDAGTFERANQYLHTTSTTTESLAIFHLPSFQVREALSYSYVGHISLLDSPVFEVCSAIPPDRWDWNRLVFIYSDGAARPDYHGWLFALHMKILPFGYINLFLDFRDKQAPQVYILNCVDNLSMKEVFQYFLIRSSRYPILWQDVELMYPGICNERPQMDVLRLNDRIIRASLKRPEPGRFWSPFFELRVDVSTLQPQNQVGHISPDLQTVKAYSKSPFVQKQPDNDER